MPHHDNESSRKTSHRHRWTGLTAVIGGMLLLLSFFVITGDVLEGISGVTSSASLLEQSLVGSWSIPVTRSDGSIENWVEEFRADGTLRYYQPITSRADNGPRVDSYWRWHVDDGDVVIVYGNRLTRNASVWSKAKELGRYVFDQLAGNNYDFVQADRFRIEDNGDDTMTFTRVGSSHQMTMTRLPD